MNEGEQPRIEALIGAAILGIVKAQGWLTMPITVDVNKALDAVHAAGGVGSIDRTHAAHFARGLIDIISEAEGLPAPQYSLEEEFVLETVFEKAYDRLAAAEFS